MKKSNISLSKILLERKPGEPYNKLKKEFFIDLITNRRRVAIYYNGLEEEGGPGWRTIEPVAIGEGNSSNNFKLNGIYVRAWLVKGKSMSNDKGKTPKPGWRLFKLSRIGNTAMTNQTFNEPQPGFNDVSDGSMTKIYAISKFGDKENLNEYLKHMVRDILK